MGADQAFEESLTRVVTRHIDGCTGVKSVERLSGGASQQTYRLVIEANGDEKVLAFRRGTPSSAIAGGKPGLAVEAQLFEAARKAGVPAPEVYYVLQDGDDLGEGFLMEWLSGETLGARIARHPDFEEIRPKLAFQCGEALARIHSIDLDETDLRSKLNVVSPEEYVRNTWESYQTLDSPQPMIDFTARWLLENLPSAPLSALVHNDFRNGNIMVDPNEGITAVLDWELAHIGDPVRDLGWICTNSWRFGVSERPVGGFGSREDLIAGYKSQSGRDISLNHIKFWEVFGSFWWACSSLGMGATYRMGLDSSVERPAIGRRTSECQIDCVNLLIPGPSEVPAPQANALSTDLPSSEELLQSVRDFLRTEIMEKSEGRQGFLARVAANSIDTVMRELGLGAAQQAQEQEALEELLGQSADLLTLKRALCVGLRNKEIDLADPALHSYLRASVVTQVAIDQPKYSGLKTALNQSGHQTDGGD